MYALSRNPSRFIRFDKENIETLKDARRWARYQCKMKSTSNVPVLYIYNLDTMMPIGRVYWKEAGYGQSTYVWETPKELVKLYSDGSTRKFNKRIYWLTRKEQWSLPVRERGWN